MKWKNVEQFNFTPGFLAKHMSSRLPDGEPPLSVKEMLNAIAYDTAVEEIINVAMYMRHQAVSRGDGPK